MNESLYFLTYFYSCHFYYDDSFGMATISTMEELHRSKNGKLVVT
jgi:hypothetical protein